MAARLKRAATLSETTSGEPLSEQASSTHDRFHAIPPERTGHWVGRLGVVEPHGVAAVRFRQLAVKVLGLLDGVESRSLLITSPLAGEGKSTVSVNLALALASVAPESRIGLIDLDLRRSCFKDVLEYEPKVGIESALKGETPLEEVCVRTDLNRLEFAPVAKTRSDAHQLLGSSADRFFRQLHARFDYVICDGPPILPVPDVPLIAPFVGGVLGVVAAGRSRHARFREAIAMVPRSKMMGVFLNESPQANVGARYDDYRALDEEITRPPISQSEEEGA